jgi:putative methyltransferase (TIGR04325 family)
LNDGIAKLMIKGWINSIFKKTLHSVFRWKIEAFGSPRLGYENEDLVELIVWKNLQLRKQGVERKFDLQSLRTISAVGLSINGSSTMKVLDFGGGGGHHQLIAKSMFPELQFEWDVAETEILSNLARQSLNAEGLNFISSSNESIRSKNFDLIFSNSAIQYTNDPLMTLETLLGLNFRKIFITRIPLTSEPKPFSYYQISKLSDNGPGLPPTNFKDRRISYKTQIRTKVQFESLLRKRLTDWISIDEGPWDSMLLGNKVRTYSFFGTATPGFLPPEKLPVST